MSSPKNSTYPHDLHPGLVPGISVDDQRNRFGLDKVLFFTTAVIIVAFIAWGIASPSSVSAAFGWAITNAG